MYPEQEARRAILRNLKHKLEDREAYSSLELDLRLRGEVSSIAEDCGLSLEEAARILRTLAEERYIHAEFGSPTGMYAFNMVKVYDLLDRGRIEIGTCRTPKRGSWLAWKRPSRPSEPIRRFPMRPRRGGSDSRKGPS